jgi:hypothetical protein
LGGSPPLPGGAHFRCQAAKPRQVLDISDARTTLLAIARIVETIDKMRKKVTVNDMMRIMEAFGRVVKVEIDQLNVQVVGAAPEVFQEQGWRRELPLIPKA